VLFDTALESSWAQLNSASPSPQAPPRPCGMRAYETPAWSHQLGSFSSGLNADRLVIRLKPTDGKTTVPQLPPCAFRYFAPLAMQIMSQLVDGELMITNNIFDQIADRDDSDQFSLVNYGKVAHSLVGHHRHAFFRS
jgi:hypothetical protein